METDQIKAKTRLEDNAAIIDLEGDIDGFAQDAIAAAYDDAIQTNAPTIILNFEDVDYINSTGIALIVSLIAQARQAGKGLLGCGLSEHYVQIFEITRLTDFIRLFSDESAALEYLRTST